MTTATAPAVEKRKKPWTKARVIDLIIDIFCFVIVGAASLTCILPFIHILAKSLSDNAYVVANRVILLPMSDAGINLDAYNKVFHDPTIMQSLWVTALVTVVFTVIGMFLTVCASYALTRCNLVRRTEKGRLRRRGWGLRWEKAQKGGKGTNLRGFFED